MIRGAKITMTRKLCFNIIWSECITRIRIVCININRSVIRSICINMIRSVIRSACIRDAGPTTPCPAPRKNRRCPTPPREKQALPRPAPQKLTKPAGRNGAKVTVHYTDYAQTFGLRVGR